MTQPIPQWRWYSSIRTIGSRKLGCDDEIDAKDARTENQALTFFGLDVNKSDVKEGCAPGEWLFHFWTYDFALHVYAFMFCSQLNILFNFSYFIINWCTRLHFVCKEKLCSSEMTLSILLILNDRIIWNRSFSRSQSSSIYVKLSFTLLLDSYFQSLMTVMLTSWQMTLSLLTDRTQLSTIHCTDYGTGRTAERTLHCTGDNGHCLTPAQAREISDSFYG